MHQSSRSDPNTWRWSWLAERHRCDLCGASFPKWAELRDHRRHHVREMINQSLNMKRPERGQTEM